MGVQPLPRPFPHASLAIVSYRALLAVVAFLARRVGPHLLPPPPPWRDAQPSISGLCPP